MSQMLAIYFLEWQKGIEIEEEKRKNHISDFSNFLYPVRNKANINNKQSIIELRYRYERTNSNVV